MSFPAPSFAHLLRLSDAGGLYEHARGSVPRKEHGYCVDDVARGLVALCREASHDNSLCDPTLAKLRAQYLAFVLDAEVEGAFHNRRNVELEWTNEPTLEDCWGRALWALGTATTIGSRESRCAALEAFERGALLRSPWPRAMSFASIGAAEVLRMDPSNTVARSLLAATAESFGPSPTGSWPWPEPRLSYANAVLPEVLIAAGSCLDSAELLQRGLKLLEWLCLEQTRHGHLSVVPVHGRAPGDVKPGFDQQPIEVASLADACARAYDVTRDPRWLRRIELAGAWFLGDNDSGANLYDSETGGGCDGLEIGGRNENQGAESTLALISTLQHTRNLAMAVL